MPLKQTQRWLQAAIVGSTSDQSAANHIAASATLAPAERVAIYRDLYPARMVSALKLDYPLLLQYLGAPVFTQLALLYAQAHPSRSFTLNEFGSALPEFLADVTGLRRPAFAVDLARFERACSEVFHEAQAAPLSTEAIAAVPPEAWEHARLQPIPALRLLQLSYPIQRYAEGQTKIPRRDCHLAIYRNNYQVRWLALSAEAAHVLTALSAGKPLQDALGNARGPVQRWFRDWMAAGLFQNIERL